MDLTKTDTQWDVMVVKDIALKALNHPIIASGKEVLKADYRLVPHFWRDQMVQQFVIRTIKWVLKYNMRPEDGKLINKSKNINWRLGTYKTTPKFEGYFQVQHLKIKVQLSGSYCTISVQDIVRSLALFRLSRLTKRRLNGGAENFEYCSNCLFDCGQRLHPSSQRKSIDHLSNPSKRLETCIGREWVRSTPRNLCYT
ncbi:hypothetical protein CC86DRAFT_412296 [Ophiobolus disseminans]|uniref:Uncharacterized protein n=1 Tax=Ophiobolus disseminans TaxID=1469910 RepID=A0A6A6ZHI0_9PLEO|nr:hypothetical protein CC86DRAFT_412296 [Ophiobolus disseminans]